MENRKFTFKIEKEEFNKLKQLDRIEYRQKESLIKSKNNPTLTFFSLIFFSIINPLLIIYTINIAGTRKYLIIFGCLFVLFFSSISILISIITDLYTIKTRDKKLEELNKEYFNFNMGVKNG